MFNKRNKCLILASMVLAAAGCSSDSPTQSPMNHKNAWGVGPVQFVTTSGKTTDLRDYNKTIQSYQLSDQLQFLRYKSDSNTDVKLTVRSHCVAENEEPFSYEVSGRLKTNYELYELLSPKVVYNTNLNTNLKLQCSFDFEARNARGDTHNFQLPQAPVESGPIDEQTLPVYVNNVTVQKNIAGYLEIHTDRLAQYSLPSMGTDTHYKLYCGAGREAVSPFDADRTSSFVFTQFFQMNSNFMERSQTPLFCQVFLLSSTGHILKQSQMLMTKPKVELPSVSDTSTPVKAVGPRSKYLNLAQLVLFNSADKPMTVAFDDGLSNPVRMRIAVAKDRKNVWGSEVFAPLEVRVRDAKLTHVNDQVRFVLAPQQSVIVDLRVSLVKLRCNGVEYPLGIYHQLENDSAVELILLNNIEAIGDENELARTRVWFNREQYVHTQLENANQPPVLIDTYKEGACRIK